MGASIVPQDILNYLTAKAYSIESEQVQAQWYESGKLYGKYLNEKFEKPLEALENLLKIGKWELSSVEVKSEANTVKVRCISAQLTIEGAETLAKFIEGAMNSLGFKTKSIECLRGMAILEFLQTTPPQH
jgi:predicted hydrocarbon binding protein